MKASTLTKVSPLISAPSILVEAVLLVHLLWCAWVMLGWTVTRGRSVLRMLHIASLIYAIVIESVPWPPCPLTLAENWLEARGDRTCAWAVSGARARRDCVSERAGVACGWRRGDCLRGDPRNLRAAIFAPDGGWPMVRDSSGDERRCQGPTLTNEDGAPGTPKAKSPYGRSR